LAESLDRALDLADGEREDGRQEAEMADSASELEGDGEGEDYFANDFDTEDCQTKAEALAEATRFARARQRQGYQVSMHEEAGLVSVWVKRPVPGPDDFTEDEKRFTFPTDDADSGESEGGDKGARPLVDPPRPQRSPGPGPHALPSLSVLLSELALSESKLKAFTSADAGLYQRFSVPKRGGSRREIAKPVPRLMAVQRRILRLIVERLPAHDASHGFRVGRSTQTNAAVHVDSKMLVKVDFQNFSSAITMPRVRGVFERAGYPADVALALALLCTAPDPAGVRRLPQGAPTTPGLSNAVCLKLDCWLAGLASRLGWRFTRYGDDLTFSFPAGETEPDVGFSGALSVIHPAALC
jgi:hypothetical protein